MALIHECEFQLVPPVHCGYGHWNDIVVLQCALCVCVVCVCVWYVCGVLHHVLAVVCNVM